MSWSFSCIGTPEAVARALDENQSQLTGQNLEEYQEALPHLKALVALNVPSDGKYPVTLDLEASGSASFINGEKNYGSCSVNIKPVHRKLVR